MSAPIILLSVGASLGIGAVAVPVYGSLLSKPITGEQVPSRLTDLAGYLTAAAAPRGFGFEDEQAQQSIGLPEGITASPVVPKPVSGPAAPPVATKATPDNRRILAVASLAAGLLTSAIAFGIIRKVLQ